jgi:hypothetical protein
MARPKPASHQSCGHARVLRQVRQAILHASAPESRQGRARRRRESAGATAFDSRPPGLGEQLRDGAIARFGFGQLFPSRLRELVVSASRSSCSLRRLVVFPRRRHEAQRFQSPQRRINSAAGQSGGVHDVESEAVALGERLQHEERGVRKRWHVCIYIGPIRTRCQDRFAPAACPQASSLFSGPQPATRGPGLG